MGKQRSRQEIDLGVSSNTLRRIIVDGEAQELVQSAEGIGRKLSRDLKTNQIRAIFGTVRQIEMSWDDAAGEARQRQAQRELILLKPKMSYRAARDQARGRGLLALSAVLAEAIDLVTDNTATDQRERFGRFVEYFEAILAYHKVEGGN